MAPQALKRLLSARLRRQRPGASGEALAARYLQRLGYRIVARNFRCRSGEIDIVAEEEGTTVFVEVKERRNDTHGRGFESVTFGKRRRLVRAARAFAASRGLWEAPLRFDVVSVDWLARTPTIRHDRDAFGLDM